MQLTYPALFTPWHQGPGYTVEVPDLPGCITEGKDLADAIFMAQDAASLWVLGHLEEGLSPPQSSPLDQIHPAEPGGFAAPIALDVAEYAAKYGGQTVEKRLAVPAWLCTFAEESGLDLSQVLRQALTAKYERYHDLLDELAGDREIDDKTAKKILQAAGIEPGGPGDRAQLVESGFGPS